MKSTRYIKLDDGTIWPVPGNYDTNGSMSLEWILRHGTPEEIIKNRMTIASYLSAYTHLVNLDNKTRNHKCSMIKKEVTK